MLDSSRENAILWAQLDEGMDHLTESVVTSMKWKKVWLLKKYLLCLSCQDWAVMFGSVGFQLSYLESDRFARGKRGEACFSLTLRLEAILCPLTDRFWGRVVVIRAVSSGITEAFFRIAAPKQHRWLAVHLKEINDCLSHFPFCVSAQLFSFKGHRHSDFRDLYFLPECFAQRF